MALLRLLEQSQPDDVFLIFCDRRVEVERLFRKLERSPFSIKALHGGYEQEARFRVMDAFRARDVKALVATDVASRGLDVKHVTHVINCGSPRDITSYTHRIGRTGRAGREGVAISIIAPPNMRNWSPILKQATWSIEEVSAPERTRRGGGPAERGRGRRSGNEGHARGGGRARADSEPRRQMRREERSERGPREETSARGERTREADKAEGTAEPRRRRRDGAKNKGAGPDEKRPPRERKHRERPEQERAGEDQSGHNGGKTAPPPGAGGFGAGV